MAEEVKIILQGEFKNKQAIVKALKQVDDGLNVISKDSEKSQKSVNSLGKSLKRLAQIAGITILAKKFLDLGKSSLVAAGNMEQFNVAFTTMLGSAEKAQDLMEEIIEFTKKTPFELEGVVASTKQLLGYGIAQEEIIPTLENLGNIASGVGVPVSRLTTVFGQVRAATRLMGQDLNQFIQAGVPLIGELATMLNRTEAEIKSMVSEGAISFDLVKQALANMTAEGGKFFNLMDAQSKTFLGTLSNAADGFNLVKVAIGNALFPVAKQVLKFIVKALDSLQKTIEANEKTITSFAQKALDGLVILWKVGLKPLIKGIGFFITGIKAIIAQPLGKWLAIAAAALFSLNGVMKLILATNPLLLAITAIVTAIGFLIEEFDNLPKGIQIALLKAVAFFKAFQRDVNIILEALFEKLSGLSNAPGFGWVDDFKDKFSNAADSISSDIDKINDQIKTLQEGGEISLTPAQAAESPEAITQEIRQEAPAEDLTALKEAQRQAELEAEKAAQEKRLEMAKATNEALLAEQDAFLTGKAEARSEADQLELENDLLKKQQEILNEEEFQERKKEIDEAFLEGKIEFQEFENELDELHRDAKLQALDEQFLAEQAKTNANASKMVEIKTNMEKERAKQTQKRNKFEKFMDSEGVKNADKAANALVQLQNSKSKELAAIGKAAAIAQITMDSARGAMSAYSAMSMIPIVGPALGAAAAAAVIAFGVEQIATASGASFAVGAAEIPQDMNANIHAGEMIIPATFAESIRSGELALSGGVDTGSLTDTIGGEDASIVINNNFDGAEFVGDISDEMVDDIATRLGESIEEDLTTAIPTRTA